MKIVSPKDAKLMETLVYKQIKNCVIAKTPVGGAKGY